MSSELIIDMVVEIPKNQSNKYEYDAVSKMFKLDRVLYGANFYPGEYGFIPKTWDEDNDPLDVISLITNPTFPGCVIRVRVLGTINMIDQGEIDTKLFGVVHDDPRFAAYQTLEDVPSHLRLEIEDFFLKYKNLEQKTVVINGWGDVTAAQTVLKHCQAAYLEKIENHAE